MNKDNLNWRLPTKDELNHMYENLHLKGIGGFADGVYWSSSESDSNFAWFQFFNNGSQYNFYKGSHARVRAVCTFHSKAGGDTYKIGEEITRGFVFDIQEDMVFICKKEDESDLMTWYEAIEKLGGKK